MSDLLAKCDWLNGDVLVLTLPQDPSSIHVRLFDSKHAPRKVYVPESYPKQWELGADYLRLGKENAKLRELIRHMWCCMNKEYTEIGLDFICNYCGKCEYNNSCGECAFGDRMRELGIEVDK